jgi:hypothetical protein
VSCAYFTDFASFANFTGKESLVINSGGLKSCTNLFRQIRIFREFREFRPTAADHPTAKRLCPPAQRCRASRLRWLESQLEPFNREAVVSFSPTLPRFAATLGERRSRPFNRKRLRPPRRFVQHQNEDRML